MTKSKLRNISIGRYHIISASVGTSELRSKRSSSSIISPASSLNPTLISISS